MKKFSRVLKQLLAFFLILFMSSHMMGDISIFAEGGTGKDIGNLMKIDPVSVSQESPRDVTDGTKIKITNLKITRTNEDTPVGGIYLRDSYEFKFNWDATAYGATLKQGDYFTVNLPESMSVVEEHANKELDIRDAQNNTVAKAVITPISTGGGTIKFTFTEFVNTHGNIKGNFNMGFRAVKEKVVVNQKNRIEITVGAKNYPIIEDGLYIRPAGTQNPNEIFGKWALGRVLTSMYQGGENLVIKDPEVLKTISKGATRWLLRINVKKADLHDVVVSDRLIGDELGDITMIPGSFAIFEGDTNEYGSAINIKNIRNISSDVQLAPDKRSFTYNLGNVDKKNYFLVYYTTYPPGSNLKVGNNATLRYDEGTPIYKESSFKESIAGGSAVGDNASKIKIIKFDADDGSVKLAKAKFELYNEDKQTQVQHDGQPVVLETGADGTAQSPQLISGTYYLKEVKAPEGYLLPKEAGIETENKGKDNFYKAVVTADGIQVFISNKSAKTSVKGTKTWEDGENQDGKRPERIKVILNKTVDGKTSKASEKEVTKDNWSYEFTDLPKYEDGKEITYSIDEEAVTGYEKEIKGYNLVNKYTPEKVSIKGTKTWEDGENRDGKRPERIKVILNKTVDGKTSKASEKEVTKDNWSYEFTDLPKYEGGKEITYSIDEEAVTGYEKEIKGYNLVNKYTPEKPTEPNKPKDPEKPTEPNKPKEPEKPTEPNKPKEPEKPTEPNKTKEPSQPTKQNNSKELNKSTVETKYEKKEQEISQTKNEELPKTGERDSAMETMVGFISIVVSMLLFMKKEKRQV